jgi:hypothetical protein
MARLSRESNKAARSSFQQQAQASTAGWHRRRRGVGRFRWRDHHERQYSSRNTNVPNSARAPLIRDRGEHSGLASLRKSALTKTISMESVRSHAQNQNLNQNVSHGGGRGRSETPTPDARANGGSAVKHRLDMQGLSPAEKARELKKINKLPASEKRELYAAYKGKGRYLAPEDL